MSTYGQPLQTSGFKTSIDNVRAQSSTRHGIVSTNNAITTGVTQLAGCKRPPENSSTGHSQFPGLTAASSIPKSRLAPSQIRRVSSDAKHVSSDSFNRPVQQSTKDSSVVEVGGELPLTLDNPCYGLPAALVANFASLGVKSIYPWQASCLLGQGLLTGERHLVYTAPTGGGKSLVADVLMLKRIIEDPSRKALLVLPYVALVQEKLKWLRRIVQDVERMHTEDESSYSTNPYHRRWRKTCRSIRVSGYFSGSRTAANWADTDIAVCTIEKVGVPSSCLLGGYTLF